MSNRYSGPSAVVVKRSFLSYEDFATADGAGDGSTLVCSRLATQPDFDGGGVVILSGDYKGQSRDINGITTAGTISPHLAFDGQILAGTQFSITTIRTTPAEVAGKPNVQDVIIYPVAEDAGTDELADDGTAPAHYPAAAHSTNANAEGAPGVAWTEDVDFEQEGTITIISIYAEFEWQTRFLVGAGAGTQSSSKIQISRDGGANWVDLTDNFDNAAAVMTGRIRAGVGVWIPTIVAGANQLAFRLVHWTDDGGGVSTSEAQIRSNSYVRITYRKS